MNSKYIGNYILRNVNGVCVAQSPILSQFNELVHYVTTRRILNNTKNELDELNMSVSNEDFPRYFDFFAKCVNISPNKCVFSHQTHSKNVKVVTGEDIGEPYWNRKLKEVDGLITNDKELFLVTTYADCMPIIAYDPMKRVVGVAHSGWRGTLLEIGKELVLKMNEEFGCNPEELFVTVGPSIGPESFEVGPDVAAEFFMKFGKDVLRKIDGNEKIHVDLWKAVEITLKSVGVVHLEFSNIDTYKHTEYFYSYRREKTKKRFAVIVGIV
ncbi:peptidoglycan editing factor PgeF [Fervidobacterium sp.]